MISDLSMVNTVTQSAQAASLFDDTKPSPSSHPNAICPRGLSQKAVIILILVIPTILALPIIMGIIHCLRRRDKSRAEAQHHADIEKSLKMARRPVLAVDTKVPRAREAQRTASSTRLPTPYAIDFVESNNLPPVPTVPESAWRLGRDRERPGMFTRYSTMRSGLGGRKVRPGISPVA